MRAKWMSNTVPTNITKGKEYSIMDETNQEFKITDDAEKEHWYKKDMFQVTARKGWEIKHLLPYHIRKKYGFGNDKPQIYVYKEREGEVLVGAGRTGADWIPILGRSQDKRKFIYYGDNMLFMDRLKVLEYPKMPF